MLKNLINSLTKGSKKELNRDEIAEMLKTTPELLEKFENAYKPFMDEKSDDFFKINSKQAAKDSKNGKIDYTSPYLDEIIDRIVDELLFVAGLQENKKVFLTADEVNSIPIEKRPQLSGKLIQKDISVPSYHSVLWHYNEFLKGKGIQHYHMFRQGLDILDLDPILYEIIGQNKNSMCYWFPNLSKAVDSTDFFKYPETKIVKVPLPLLQLTRLPYEDHNSSTIKILNKFCMKAFDLDVNKKYFIKTGTYSSKFDFRNALVEDPKEIREIGEYLLFIHFQALQMASSLSTPTIYGVSTTNEWVVREFIEDVEENPTIYKGMPLRTEYRFFVDFDKKSVIGVSPYWREDVMLNSLKMNPEDPHKQHDYVIYKSHQEKLYKKYNDNVGNLKTKVEELIQKIELSGQWSLDIMQNGSDFYIIDMAEASASALNDCVPKELLKKNPENWIPKLEEKSNELE